MGQFQSHQGGLSFVRPEDITPRIFSDVVGSSETTSSVPDTAMNVDNADLDDLASG